tara:strand:- start:15012 stop:15635 length:624 start_codon:yes stop_codon:yes gene_type:complete
MKYLLFLLYSISSIANSENFVKITHSDGLYGSGVKVFYKGTSYIATNGHICLKNDYSLGKNSLPGNLKVKTEKTSFLIKNPKIKVDFNNDMCLIEANFKEGFKISLIDPRIGETVYYKTLNNPKEELSVKKGIILGIKNSSSVENFEGKKHFQSKNYIISTNTVDGDSGSGVFNDKNELIGLVFASARVNKNNWGSFSSFKSSIFSK